VKPIATTTFNLLRSLYLTGKEQEHAELALAHLRAGSRVQNIFVLDDHPEQWKAFFERSLKKLFEDRAGYLYIASNDEKPGWLKVGKTRLSPLERMEALNNEAVTGTIHCEFALAVHDRHYCETEAHKWLESKAHLRKKEFFQVSLDTAREACFRVAEEDFLVLAEAGVEHLVAQHSYEKR
jgi:hypothetical protein